MDFPISKKDAIIQGCMSLSTYKLKYGRHLVRLRRRRRRGAYAPTSNTASHVPFPSFIGMGLRARAFGTQELRYYDHGIAVAAFTPVVIP